MRSQVRLVPRSTFSWPSLKNNNETATKIATISLTSLVSIPRDSGCAWCSHSGYPESDSGSELQVAVTAFHALHVTWGRVSFVNNIKQMFYALLISSVAAMGKTNDTFISHFPRLTAMNSGNAGVHVRSVVVLCSWPWRAESQFIVVEKLLGFWII